MRTPLLPELVYDDYHYADAMSILEDIVSLRNERLRALRREVPEVRTFLCDVALFLNILQRASGKEAGAAQSARFLAQQNCLRFLSGS